MKISNLYVLEFPNGKKYLGISVNPQERFRGHIYSSHKSTDLLVYSAFRKYGAENIKLRILCTGYVNYIKDLEIKAIAQFKTRDPKFGYNVSIGGDLWAFGVKRTPEQIEKRVNSRKTNGKTWSLESRQKASVSQKIRAEREKEKRKAHMIVMAKSPNRFGDTHRKRLSENKKNYWANLSFSERSERSAKLSAVMKTPERLTLHRSIHVGRKRSEETRAKLRTARSRQISLQKEAGLLLN